jgi:choline dehydrogenase-like flavoprotein
MIGDLDEHEREELPAYDLCIIGSGPAGGVVAAELRDAGLRICVLESGRARNTRHGDLLREVRSEGIRIKDYSRERCLGGASTTWAGLSSPFDPIDFAHRPYLEQSGWPITREALFEDYARAAERYRFPPLSFFGPDGFAALGERGDLKPAWRSIEEKVFLAAAEPQDFGRELVETYTGEAVDLWFDATVLRLEHASGHAERAVVRTRSGREFVVRARAFVVGAGGIENPRLLLVSGLGNEHDQVGRYLMNHPKNYYGLLELARPVEELPYYFGCLYHGYAGYAGLRLSEAVQAERGLVNSYVRFEPLFPWSDNDGVESLVLFVKRSKFILTFWKKQRSDEVVSLRDYSETGDDTDLQNQRKSFLGWLGLGLRVLANLPSVAQYLYYRLSRARLKVRRVRLRNFMEMEPSAANRVTLSDETDVYGTPLAHVRHDTTEVDRRTMVELHETLVEEVAELGLGKLDSRLGQENPWPIDLDASHHMGTTRMGTDPATSVVDANLKLHQVDNVYMAGASVLPTSGCANPTFTLVALSIRLARHLSAHVFAAEAVR